MVEWQAVYQVGLAVSTAVSGVAALIAWRNREENGGKPLVALLAAAGVWAGSSLLGTLRPGTRVAVVSEQLVLTSVLVLVPSLLVFAFEYTGRGEYVTRRALALLSVQPAVMGALIWTNERHGLVWSTVETTVVGVDDGGLNGVTVTVGPAFQIHTIYSYLLLASAVVLIVVFALRSRYLYQRQVAAVVVATLVPWAANVVSMLSDLPFDPTAIAFTVTGVVFTWAVVRERFLDITPVATEVVLDTIETAVLVADERGRVVDSNESACELLGVSQSDAVGSDVAALFTDRLGEQAYPAAATTGRSASTHEIQVGEEYYRMQVSPLVERRGEVVGRVFMLVDLTDQRQRELELRRRNEQLDRFVGVVSHDLRNPLQVASGRLELARRDGADEHFDAVERSHDRMERLIEDLLSIARQDEDLDLERVEVEAVAESAWTHVDTFDSSLEVSVDGLTVDADRDRLSQLFENLFRNAVEHGSTSSRPGADDAVQHGGDVAVSVEPLADERGFAVADDGPGFDDADLESVFDDGFTTTRDGTGFGLSIVTEIAAQHGWSVAAANGDGGGARIEVYTGEKTAKVN
ncbi:histidine kinase N-terminal 7TM domain-containing protein [Halosimplex salinum]|uniref:histidine kinase N-terminal 7TM domain-containing protein n=1 Tax=Halosimplex salinum TaxID=1710538 RepID=UPI000F464226|nr:histidine kinase N-terminal 7TM domain-containing protein [Halosimplex salinum]